MIKYLKRFLKIKKGGQMYSNFGQLALKHDLNQAVEIMSSTWGYKNLDDYRQKLMRVALLIQHRLDHQIILGNPRENYKYVKSVIFLLGINCFNSVSCVEKGVSFSNNYHPKAVFFQGNYNPLRFSIPQQANFFISRVDFPNIVHIKGNLNDNLPYHSLIALGETDDRKDIVTWEKGSKDHPYRVTTLSKVFNGYQNCYWAVRPFQTPH